MQKTLTYIDINTRAQVYADGAFVTKSSDYINIERGQWQILCIQFGERQMDEAGAVTFTPISFDTDTSFVFVADNNFDDDDYLMAKSLQSVIPFDEADPTSNMFNIEGDWVDGGTADFSSGQLSIRINSDTVKFKEVTTDKVSINTGMYINVKQYMQGLSNPSTIAWIPFIAKNTIRDWSSAQVIPPTGTEAIAFINAYFRNPLERQWSEDGITWFDSQSEEHDNYYRERIANVGADWSSGYAVARGFTYTPSVSSDGVISWINDGDLPNPTPINIKGDPGNGLAFDASGPVSELAQYDAEAEGFVFFATDEGNFYVKNSATSADWSAAIPLRGETGPTIIADPVTEMAVADETWGDCRYLDAAFRQLSFRGRVRSLRRVSLETVSIDSGVTGNIVLVPIVNGSELPGTSFVVAVGAEPAVAEFALEFASGTLALRRDTDDERDTLKDSGNTPVTAVVLSVILEVQYDA